MAPCWSVLEELGYTVTTRHTAGTEIWIAQKAGEELQAHDPCTLLGLAKLVEVKGECWQAPDEQITEFLQRFYEAG